MTRALDVLHSALHPYSAEARILAEFGWLLIVGGSVIFVAVLGLAAWAVMRRPGWLASERSVLIGGIGFPAITLLALLVFAIDRLRTLSAAGPPEVRIEVTGHQWWWRVRYLANDGSLDFETANEIRIPAGRSIEVALVSNDVLHSFWVPALARKLDLVPGRVNRMRLSADVPGIYRGQCAEYCGGPHGQMALHVVAQTPEAFETWRHRQREPVQAALDPSFAAHCSVCHAIRGTKATGSRGPDLTHVGGRLNLAAGTLRNERGALARWTASSQHLKPGNGMPSFGHLRAEELRALGEFLAELR